MGTSLSMTVEQYMEIAFVIEPKDRTEMVVKIVSFSLSDLERARPYLCDKVICDDVWVSEYFLPVGLIDDI